MRASFILITASAAILVSSVVPLETNVEAAEVAGGTITDLTRAVVVAPRDLSVRERKAVTMLTDEVEKRTQIRWQVAAEWPRADGTPVVAVGRESNLQHDYPRTKPWLKLLPARSEAEGYRIQRPE